MQAVTKSILQTMNFYQLLDEYESKNREFVSSVRDDERWQKVSDEVLALRLELIRRYAKAEEQIRMLRKEAER